MPTSLMESPRPVTLFRDAGSEPEDVCYPQRFLLDQGKAKQALQWIARSRPNPPNLSNVNLPEDAIYRQREYFITGRAHKMLDSTAMSQEFFRRVGHARAKDGNIGPRPARGHQRVQPPACADATLTLDAVKAWDTQDPFLAPAPSQN
jgi:hypothetical protein